MYVCNSYNTRAVNGKTLFNVLMNKMISRELKDTAYMASDEFSPVEHNHDDLYNKLSIQLHHPSQKTYSMLSAMTDYISFTDNAPDSNDSVLSIGNLFVDGLLVPIEIPLSSISDMKTI